MTSRLDIGGMIHTVCIKCGKGRVPGYGVPAVPRFRAKALDAGHVQSDVPRHPASQTPHTQPNPSRFRLASHSVCSRLLSVASSALPARIASISSRVRRTASIS